MKYNRTEIGDKIGFSAIIDEKFKSSYISIRFITKLDKKTAAENVLAISGLTDTNEKYNTIAEMSEILTELYGASLSSSARKRGDLQILTVSSSWLSSKYALYGEDIEKDMLDIVSDCVFRPNIVNGEFESESFAINRMELLDRIDAEFNNKRGYVITKACETAFKGEPAQLSCYGDRETAENVTAAQTYDAYKNLLETAQIEIFFVSSAENPYAEKVLRDGFAEIKRSPVAVQFKSISPVKAEPVELSEQFDVNQCKMVMAFKTVSDDEYALHLLSVILGESPVSKLFTNVREKLSLCYYCASHMALTKGTLLIDSGVERVNIEKAKTEIVKQIDEIRNGNVSDEEIESAVLAAQNSLEQVGDTMYSYASWFFDRYCDDDFITSSEMLEIYRGITKERIVNAARSLVHDCTYIMLDREEA